MDKDLPWHVNPTPAVPLRKKAKRKKNPTARRILATKAKMEATATREAERPFQVALRRSHNVNGTTIGPGTFTLPGPLARELSAREYHCDREEEKFRGERAAIIGGRTAQGSHRVTMVPPETFSESYGGAMPMERVSGLNSTDPGQGSKF